MVNKTIVIAHFVSVVAYPPVINLIENLLSNHHRVRLVSVDVHKLPERILSHENFQYVELVINQKMNVIDRFDRRFIQKKRGQQAVAKFMKDADLLWTTTDRTALLLGKMLENYPHVMQLMELVKEYPYFRKLPFLKFPIHKYAQSAKAVVVPEVNRAYIQKVWWNLEKVPYVLPNKSYRLEPGDLGQEEQAALNIMKEEKRKIVLYLGAIGKDRDLRTIAKGLALAGEEYCLYVVGRCREKERAELDEIVKENKNVVYLGYFSAPKHLAFLEYAYMGVLPYKPSYDIWNTSELNALYCAPNKIFEYSGFGVPMLGSDVIGLKLPFEQYNIGVCYTDVPESVNVAIAAVEKDYATMQKNCLKYYESYDLDKIVDEIINI